MPEDIVLEHLRAVRNDIADLKNEMRGGFKDMRSRLASIEQHGAADAADAARQSAEIDELRDRIERLESRLELRDA